MLAAVPGGFGVGSPTDLDHLDRLGESFEGDLPHGDELLGGVPAGQSPGHGRGQDLAALGVGAEPRCFDDRLSKEVPVLLGGLTGRQPHPDGERLHVPAVVTLDCLLHPDGTGQRPAQTGEGDHESVAQALHLDPAGRTDRRP